jgi:hypothetical protein
MEGSLGGSVAGGEEEGGPARRAGESRTAARARESRTAEMGGGALREGPRGSPRAAGRTMRRRGTGGSPSAGKEFSTIRRRRCLSPPSWSPVAPYRERERERERERMARRPSGSWHRGHAPPPASDPCAAALGWIRESRERDWERWVGRGEDKVETFCFAPCLFLIIIF